MNLGTKIYTLIYGNYVGNDEFGNQYYCNSKNFDDSKSKRWVMFKGEVEASKVPPHWHAWLHKTVDIPPLNYAHKYSWQKEHKTNLTGTSEAYLPNSHPLSKSKNKGKIDTKYEKWQP